MRARYAMPYPRVFRPFLTLVAVLLCVSPARAVTDEEVDAAIKRMQDWIFSQQKPDGSWSTTTVFPGEDKQHAGETAIVTLALLVSGQTPQHPKLDLALRWLRAQEMNGTYAVSMRTHVWAALPPDPYRENLRLDAEWLMKAQKGSIWYYSPVFNPQTMIDHSTTQYGLLGLWEFSKHGDGRVPRKIWEDAVAHFIKTQNADGGWQYRPVGDNESWKKSTGSMTAAGLTVLFVAQQELFRDADAPPKQLTEAIQKGLAWLDKNFSPTANPGRNNDYAYYLYGIERVALASGVKTFGGKDWFESGADGLLKKENKRGNFSDHGGPLANTAFALMFLSRGKVPVWATKLQITGAPTNNRPNDLYFLTRFLSDQGEQELNWQTLNPELSPRLWMNAPVAYLSALEAVELSATQKTNLKTFIERGGLLFGNAENGAPAFAASMKKLMEELYPEYKLEPMKPDNPLLDAVYRVEPRLAASFLVMSNGARDLAIVSQKDLGKDFQGDTDQEGEAWDVATNLYSLVTEGGWLQDRLAQKVVEKKAGATKKGDIKVARVRYDGAWDLERHAWEPHNAVLFNQSNYEMIDSDIDLANLAGSDAALVHLAGSRAVTLTDVQKQAIKAYAEKGGTVLIETIGGTDETSDFSIEIARQLAETFGTPPTPVRRDDKVFSGQGVPGAMPCNRLLFRVYSITRRGLRARPGEPPPVRLAAFRVGDRPAVFVSDEDLSMGVFGMQRWGIHGYQPDSAAKLLSNLLLTANQTKKK